MANTIEFILKLKDLMSGGMRQAATTAQTAFTAVDRKISSVQRNMNTMSHSTSALSKRLDDLKRTREISIDRREIVAANREIDRLERRIDRVHNMGVRRRNGGAAGAGMLGFGMGRMAASIAGLGLVAGMSTGVGYAANAGLQGGATRTSMEVLAGQQQGAKLYADLTKFAQDSIFGNEVYKNSQTMLAFGVAADNLMPRLKMLGDISMGNKDRFQSLTLAYSQSMAAGRLMGQDVLQMVNAGFNPLQEISEMTGISMAKLKEQMEKGAISSEMVTKAFEHATSAGGKFYNMTEKIGNTPFGKWEALKGQASGIGLAIGEQIAPFIGRGIDKYARPFMDWIEGNFVPKVTGFLEGFGDFVNELKPRITAFAHNAYKLGGALWDFITSDEVKGLASNMADLSMKIVSELIPVFQTAIDVLKPVLGTISEALAVFKKGLPDADAGSKTFAHLKYDKDFRTWETEVGMVKAMEDANRRITQAGKTIPPALADINKMIKVPGAKTALFGSENLTSTASQIVKPVNNTGANRINGGGISEADFKSLEGSNKSIAASGPKMITVNFNRALVEGNTVHVNSVEEAEGFFDEKVQQSVMRTLDTYFKQ